MWSVVLWGSSPPSWCNPTHRHAVGLVVADDEPLFLLQQRHEEMGETRIAIVEHANMPGPRHALEDRREAVHRDQRGQSPGFSPPVELGFDPIVVWPENLAQRVAFRALSLKPMFPGTR